MKSIASFLPEPEKPDELPKEEYSYQVLGKEMLAYYGKRHAGYIWSRFHLYREDVIRDAFIAAQKAGKSSVSYLQGILNKP